MIRKKSTTNQWNRGSGSAYVISIIALALFTGFYLTRGVIPRMDYRSQAATETKTTIQTVTGGNCCDSGNGANCRPLEEKQITFNGEQYGLLKSYIAHTDVKHLEISNPAQYANPSTSEGRIFFNNSDKVDIQIEHPTENCPAGQDYIQGGEGHCFGVPNDQIIYVCRAPKEECDKDANLGTLPFDVYFRMKDYTEAGIPSTISQCVVPTLSAAPKQKIINLPTSQGHSNLQLETFQVLNEAPPAEWLTSWCKPAINLYPTKKTTVHVVVSPKAPFTYTIPTYPEGGWYVTAYPNGEIISEGKTYPYLYWEAAFPDNLLTKPKEGYVIAYKDMSNLFAHVLPQLGLNQKEINEFSTYWLKALPDSPYYFIGMVPEEQIDYLAPLTIQPRPDSTLRVSFYFEALDKKRDVIAPKLTPFKRTGFTVTEWGGFFKGNKNHPNFTCWM